MTKISRDQTGPVVIAMLDLMADGKWHDKEEVLTAGRDAALKKSYTRCIKYGSQRLHSTKQANILAKTGGRHLALIALLQLHKNGRVMISKKEKAARMKKPVLRSWVSQKNKIEGNITLESPGFANNQRFGKIAILPCGLNEWEGWAHAPLIARDLVHLRLANDIDIRELEELFPGFSAKKSPEGVVTIAGPVGSPVKKIVMEWVDVNNIPHNGVREAHNVRRRNLRDLPPQFLHEIMEVTLPVAERVVARKHKLSMDVLAEGHDDALGWIQLWVVELAEQFDPTSGTPFGAYVTLQVKRRVQDLNRAKQGRTASDLEIKFARAEEALGGSLGRIPTDAEIGKYLNFSVQQVRSKRALVESLKGLQNAATLDSGPESQELPIPDLGPTPEQSALSRERRQRVSMALVQAAMSPDDTKGKRKKADAAPDRLPLGFLVAYLSEYTAWTKTDLMTLAKTSPQTVNKELERLHNSMRDHLQDFREID